MFLQASWKIDDSRGQSVRCSSAPADKTVAALACIYMCPEEGMKEGRVTAPCQQALLQARNEPRDTVLN